MFCNFTRAPWGRSWWTHRLELQSGLRHIWKSRDWRSSINRYWLITLYRDPLYREHFNARETWLYPFSLKSITSLCFWYIYILVPLDWLLISSSACYFASSKNLWHVNPGYAIQKNVLPTFIKFRRYLNLWCSITTSVCLMKKACFCFFKLFFSSRLVFFLFIFARTLIFPPPWSWL